MPTPWGARAAGALHPPIAPVEIHPAARTGRDRLVDASVVLAGIALGALLLTLELVGTPRVLTGPDVVVDAAAGLLAGAALTWQRRWPLTISLVTLALGSVSIAATAPALVALFLLAVRRPARPALLAAALWVPSVVLFGVYSPTTDPVSALTTTVPVAVAATAWGMFVRARRMLVASLRERALQAEADQRLREERIRTAERTRIAREMHDVLAHRISLLALHAGGLEVRPDLPEAEVRATATLMRSTARQALEELRSVIGVLRDQDGGTSVPVAPQATLTDLHRLVDERRSAGARIDLQVRVEDPAVVPASLGRDAYRIVQEALTNVAKHADQAPARVLVEGSEGRGLRVSVRNPDSGAPTERPALPGAGAGLLGLQERVDLAGGTLVHGPDGSGDFVVEAELRW
jgi:signal transduction histidine kinase